MPRKLNTYMVNLHRIVPGLQRHRRMVRSVVAAPSRKAAAEAFGPTVSVYYLTTYGLDAPDDAAAVALAEPGRVFYTVHDFGPGPWCPWDQDYPLDKIPESMRDPEFYGGPGSDEDVADILAQLGPHGQHTAADVIGRSDHHPRTVRRAIGRLMDAGRVLNYGENLRGEQTYALNTDHPANAALVSGADR